MRELVNRMSPFDRRPGCAERSRRRGMCVSRCRDGGVAYSAPVIRRGVMGLPWWVRSGWGARNERRPGTGSRRQHSGLYCIAKRMEWCLGRSEPVGQPDEGGLYDRHAEAQVTLDARSCA